VDVRCDGEGGASATVTLELETGDHVTLEDVADFGFLFAGRCEVTFEGGYRGALGVLGVDGEASFEVRPALDDDDLDETFELEWDPSDHPMLRADLWISRPIDVFCGAVASLQDAPNAETIHELSGSTDALIAALMGPRGAMAGLAYPDDAIEQSAYEAAQALRPLLDVLLDAVGVGVERGHHDPVTQAAVDDALAAVPGALALMQPAIDHCNGVVDSTTTTAGVTTTTPVRPVAVGPRFTG
jgi:hypothetical protein